MKWKRSGAVCRLVNRNRRPNNTTQIAPANGHEVGDWGGGGRQLTTKLITLGIPHRSRSVRAAPRGLCSPCLTRCYTAAAAAVAAAVTQQGLAGTAEPEPRHAPRTNTHTRAIVAHRAPALVPPLSPPPPPT